MSAIRRFATQYFGAATSSSPNSTETTTVDPPRRSNSLCFRIEAIPLGWNEDRLLDALKTVDPSIKEDMLKVSLYPSCDGSHQQQTALLVLNTCNEYFSTIQSNDPPRYLSVEGEPEALAIDREFKGLTPLNTPQDPVADVIAVTGLAGHPFGSWRHRETGWMWLHDCLPKHVQNLRIMTYGYNSSLTAQKSREHFEEYASDLLQAISRSRWDYEEKNRPIIFIGHSMGGLLILQALIKSKSGTQYLYHSTFTSTRQIFLFGVPLQGMEVDKILLMIEKTGGKSSTRWDLVRQLSKEGSNFLNTQRASIVDLWPIGSTIRIVSLYERLPSPTVQRDPSAAGNYTVSGPETQMVEMNSALLFWPSEYRIGVPSNHTNLVKFGNGSDKYYLQVVQQIKECIEEIMESRGFQGMIKRRW